MKVAILGGGNGCYAAAADFAKRGHEVRMWRRQAQRTPDYAIAMKDKDGEHKLNISVLTPDIGEAVRGAELIVIPTPAFSHEDIGPKLAPHLADGQVVFLPPGTFGSLVLWRALRQSGNKADVAFAETGTLPYLTRKHGEANVAITAYAVRLPTGVLPARLTDHAMEVLRSAYPVLPIEDALSGALMNAGPIIHPPLILMNAGPLEHFPAWDIHNEGTQASIRAVTNALDEDRMRVREALGYRAPHFPLRDNYENDQWMYGDAHQQLMDSGDWREKIDLHKHRYMTEDVHYGLALLVSVGDWCGVPTPVASGLLAIAAAIGGKTIDDLKVRGPRTLATLGLDKLAPAELKQRLATGENL